ncbi:TIGR03085 family metal-binding protein [Corynebacterium callunae]|uniref:TIGR03085 family metal-binding protein n=1 Tax=Corynebacterium callunae TaxID=1721 RepID=UPI0039825E24
MKLSAFEREALKDALLEKGPDAPTLCGEWKTRDLAVHLLVREQHPLSFLRSQLPVGGDPAEELTEQNLERPYEDVVYEWAAGPKGLNPWRALDSIGNAMEHFIHHEDVRRGALTPGELVEEREISPEHARELHRLLKMSAPRFIKADRPVILAPTGMPRIVYNDKSGVSKDGQSVIRVQGGVGELILWIYGRKVVNVDIEGDTSNLNLASL